MKRILQVLFGIALLISNIGCGGNAGTSNITVRYLEKNTTDPSAVSNEYRTVSQTDRLIFQFNDATTDIRIVDKSNNYCWGTDLVPDSDETLYNLLYLTYHTDSGNVGFLSAENHCISNGQYKIEAIENGIKVKYTLGDVSTEYIYPESLTPERYEYFYGLCDDDGKYLLEIVYTRIDISFYDEVTQAEMNEKYPYASNGIIYIPRNVLNDVTKAELSDMFKSIGYTKEDLKTDHTEFENDTKENIAVNISIYYKVDGDMLTVTIPESEIEYPDYLHVDNIKVLECFTGETSYVGYFVLPDGSGSIMNFRNNKVAENYRVQIYGAEKTITAENKTAYLQNAPFPVYGCVSDNNAYFVIIEDGESHAYINAVSGNENTAPRAWVDFTVEPVDYMVVEGSTMIDSDQKNPVYQTERYDGSLSFKYKFFSGNEASYTKMAEYYQSYLFGDELRTVKKEYPLTLKTVGAIKQTETSFGFNYTDLYTLTTFSESGRITDDLLESGIAYVNLIMTGWTGEGFENGYSDKLRPIRDLGNIDELKAVINRLNGKNVEVYLDFDVQYAAKSIKNRKIAILLNESKATFDIYDKAVFTKISSPRYVLTPDVMCEAIANASIYSEDYSCGLSFSTIGSDLNADYNIKNVVDRQDSLKKLVNALAVASGNNKIFTDVGNAYVLPFVRHISNVSIESNGQDMTDYDIPFTAMVLSGCVEYSAPPFNDGYSEKVSLLKMIESNAGMSAIITANDTIYADISEYSLPNATKYDDLKEELISSYKYISTALDGVYGMKIKSHIIHDNGIRELVFENGAVIYINYGSEALDINGRQIEPLSYMRG